MERQLIEISTGTILKFIFLGLVLAFLFVIRDIVAIFLLAIVIAYALDPAINWFQNKKIPRVFAVLFIYIGSLAVLTLLFYLIVPPLFFEVKNFAAESPQFLEKITLPLTNQNLEGASIIPPSLLENIQDFFGSISNLLANFSQGFIQTLIRLFGGIFSAVLILVIAFYLSFQEKGVENSIKMVVPKEYEDYALKIWRGSSQKIGFWLEGQILLGIIVGTLVFLALTILQVKYALSLALLAALLEIIPIFGPIIAAFPAVVIAFLQEPILGLIMIGVYFLIQQIENHLIYPAVMRRTVGVPPLLAIFALLIGGKLAGFIGFVLAVPMAVIFIEIANDLAERKRVADK